MLLDNPIMPQIDKERKCEEPIPEIAASPPTTSANHFYSRLPPDTALRHFQLQDDFFPLNNP